MYLFLSPVVCCARDDRGEGEVKSSWMVVLMSSHYSCRSRDFYHGSFLPRRIAQISPKAHIWYRTLTLSIDVFRVPSR